MYVSGSISVKIGFPPARTTASAVATKVKLGSITSSPFLIPIAINAACNAAVPVLTAMACFTPANSANFFFKLFNFRSCSQCVGEYSGFHHFNYCLDFFFAYFWNIYGDQCFSPIASLN